MITLLELMVYANLSYPVGAKEECTIILKDAKNEISTPTITYQCDDNLYVMLYLLSNKAISNIYRLIDDEIEQSSEKENPQIS